MAALEFRMVRVPRGQVVIADTVFTTTGMYKKGWGGAQAPAWVFFTRALRLLGESRWRLPLKNSCGGLGRKPCQNASSPPSFVIVEVKVMGDLNHLSC